MHLINPHTCHNARRSLVFTTVMLCLLIGITTPAFAFDPAAGDFSKSQPNLIRVMTWNVLDRFIANPSYDARFRRVIEAVNPDIIAFQEIDHKDYGSNNAIITQVKARLESYQPHYTWRVHVGEGGGNKNVICSRYPISMLRRDTDPGSNIRGVCCALVDLPDAQYDKDLYVMGVHFKCCDDSVDDHRRRQIHADAITNWMRDARTPGGKINLPQGTPMLVVGDTNLLNRGDAAPYHAARTLLDGTIYHQGQYGQSSPPDWDGSHNAEAATYDHVTGNPGTHSSSNPIARNDRCFYTDSVMHHVNRFIVNTRTMSPAARTAAGLLENDSAASDHLPCVVDFALGPDPLSPPQLIINEYSANDLGGDDRTFVEFKNIGGREINLDAPQDLWLKHARELPASVPINHNEDNRYNLKGVVPAGGLFVLFNGGDESSAIRQQIISNLPPLQRQNVGSFLLRNHNNSAIALIEQGRMDVRVTLETAVEAYGYAADSPGNTRYFRTNSGNNLLIWLTPNQWTSFNVNQVGFDTSISRNPGDTTLNSYANWTIGATMTPALENAPPATVDSWMLY